MLDVRGLRPGDADACDSIIASLPYHFGHEGGRRECALAVRTQDGLVAELDGSVVGFLTISRHFDRVAEITWMAVHADNRRQGIGHTLIGRLCEDLLAEDRQLLLVMTVSPSDPDDDPDGYRGTRSFYMNEGFVLARDFPGYWDSDTPVLMVRHLG